MKIFHGNLSQLREEGGCPHPPPPRGCGTIFLIQEILAAELEIPRCEVLVMIRIYTKFIIIAYQLTAYVNNTSM
jgi:hypothetical protein